jgi:uncharacterized membrane protein
MGRSLALAAPIVKQVLKYFWELPVEPTVP